MKKLLLLTILVLISVSCYAVDSVPAGLNVPGAEVVTADTPAAEPTLASKAMKAGIALLAIVLNFFTITIAPMIHSYLKGKSHNKYSDVITDSFFAAYNELADIGKKILEDGIVTDTERKQFDAAWRRISKDKLTRLSGFAKKDIDAWIDEQMKVTLGKLLARISV